MFSHLRHIFSNTRNVDEFANTPTKDVEIMKSVKKSKKLIPTKCQTNMHKLTYDKCTN